MVVDPLTQAREVAVGFLQANRAEIAQSALARVQSVADGLEAADDPEYAAGLRATVFAALDYGVAVIEAGDEDAPALPAALLEQARLAAVGGISLDTVLRRYIAGFAIFGDYVIRGVQAADPSIAAELPRLLQARSVHFDHLVASVSDEYNRVRESRFRSAEQRRVERVKRLLAGELVDDADLAYDFDAWHLGAVVSGPGAPGPATKLLKQIDSSSMVVRIDEDIAWIWLGGAGKIDSEEVESALLSGLPPDLRVTLGEPAVGLAGWRLTHRQARAALPVALWGAKTVVRYIEVALLASILQDELLSTSIREAYIAPLKEERDDGKAIFDTLRAFFSTERNMTSAAALLGVSRQTVANRIQFLEDRLGCTLADRGLEIELALRLHDISSTEAVDTLRVPSLRPAKPSKSW